MSKFTRAAPWLRHFFTPSKTSPVNPTEVSEDVSLVQPYDGSGWPLQPIGEWMSSVAPVIGATGTETLVTAGEREIVRILAVSIHLAAGVAPLSRLLIQDPNAVVGSVGVSDELTVSANFRSFAVRTPILAPGHLLRGQYEGGDAATGVVWRMFICRCPIGTVFYV